MSHIITLKVFVQPGKWDEFMDWAKSKDDGIPFVRTQDGCNDIIFTVPDGEENVALLVGTWDSLEQHHK